MEIGDIQPQIWFSMFVMIAAAGIAALATLLKRKNNEVRDLMAQVHAKQQEENRRRLQMQADSVMILPPVRMHTAVEPAPPPAPAIVDLKPAPSEPEPVRDAPPVEAAAPAAGPEAVTASPAPAEPVEIPAARDTEVREPNVAIPEESRNPALVEPLPKLDPANPKEALSEWLNRRAAARASRKSGAAPFPLPAAEERNEPTVQSGQSPIVEAQPAAVESEPEPVAEAESEPEAPAAVEPEPEPVAEAESELETPAAVEPEPAAPESVEPLAAIEPEPEPVAEGESEPEAPAAVEPEPVAAAAAAPVQRVGPVVFIDESLFESILTESAALKQVRFEVIHGSARDIPAGLHDAPVLSRLFEANKPFRGLIVLIRVSLTDGRAPGKDLMLHIRQLVSSLLREDDFASQTADDEFLVLCPGADAQPRMIDISEHLWDFQLRGAGSFSVLFTTGHAHSEGEPLRQAFVSASARLEQTRRAGKLVSLDSVSRKSVSAAV